MRALLLAAAAVSSLFLVAGEGKAQSSASVGEALRAGIVGERYDGYIGFVAAPSERLRRQVSAVNIRRRTLYTNLATKRGVAPQTVGFAAGCALLSRVAVGQPYMLADGSWRRRDSGEPPPLPEHCRTR